MGWNECSEVFRMSQGAGKSGPQVVQLVMECVLLLEPMPTGGATGWRAALKLLTKPQAFMAALQDYPTGQPRVPTESRAQLSEPT